jgi:DMSO/TMAO reductase YedYZ molybdopterin-dependent catalytic subunit
VRQIAQNAGVDGSVVAGKIMDTEDASFVFNAQTEEYGDVFKFGIIDPAKVVRHRASGRRVGRRSPNHNRGDNRREARSEGPRRRHARRHWRHGRHDVTAQRG